MAGEIQTAAIDEKEGADTFLATNLLETSTSFSDESLKDFRTEKYNITLPVSVDYDVNQYGESMLKNYYMHQKKSWSFPEIKKITEYIVYLPYAIEEYDKKVFLVEESTGMKKKISKRIKYMNFYKGDKCI
ncbi:hypothetical protein [Jeotgalicoccus sp. WY2]|uniref:hypothetical protein n=1 Tax=Jeotgalicoccus sp. WY2 TaxID=2708346 RepID=UPI001BD49ADB|nr:hypothetical protein [Jeotgalicoccus sp. WY2]